MVNAFGVPKEGRALTEADVIAHCLEVLAHFRCPKAVEFWPLPKTSTGKVQKLVLASASGASARSGSTNALGRPWMAVPGPMRDYQVTRGACGLMLRAAG